LDNSGGFINTPDKARKQNPSKHGRADEWTRERIERLSAPDLKQLRANAERLSEPELVMLCSEVLKARPRVAAALPGKPVARAKAPKQAAA
jgi:hypothetical protein